MIQRCLLSVDADDEVGVVEEAGIFTEVGEGHQMLQELVRRDGSIRLLQSAAKRHGDVRHSINRHAPNQGFNGAR